MFYIYRIVNTINEHDYIGKRKAPKSLSPIEDSYMGSGVRIKEAIQKYGRQNFRKEILEANLTLEEAIEREVFWIKNFKEKGLAVYNISPGCEGFDPRNLVSSEALKAFNDHKANKVRENWQNISSEKYQQRTLHMKEAWADKTPSKKEDFSKKRSRIQKEVYSQLTEEQRRAINGKRIVSLKKMHEDRPEETQKEISNKISQSLLKYNSNLSEEQKKKISQKQSDARKRYLLTETEEHKKECGKKLSLAKGKWYKIRTPEGKELIIKALAYWCRQEFGDKGNSASATFHQRGAYKGYTLLGEVPAESES